MALKDDIAVLARVPLFEAFDEEQLRLVAFSSEHKRLAAGDVLFEEHAPAESAYVVLRGVVELSNTGRDGQSRPVSAVDDGTMLSELALVTAVERKYTAVARGELEVLRITRASFHRLIEEYPSMARQVEDRIRAALSSLAKRAGAMEHKFR
ncbi:cyclic nucleotide-binding domain-containing protein [Rhizobium halophytocola]|uniref:CRP-like cAMP-binding protein n=1 Tax=Rhizobium halophytocola TaxID=735519 RepID=A0ABS4E1W3_9HYPH|nr:cyclic nucleotide-binding domain-containing protein [Rhizobium halophytocola]MBP1851928.1 CRP-like cAMP-binding protein [Rhizobium halophytocola]